MGRRAKYLTLCDRREAHRKQKQVLKLRPSASLARKAENRRYYLKHKPAPILPSDIKRHSVSPISWSAWSSVFVRFCQGEDMLIVEELELDTSDLEALIGLPPYPAHVTRPDTFEDIWGPTAAALHGYLTSKYTSHVERRMINVRDGSETDAREESWSVYRALLNERQLWLSRLSTERMLDYTPTDRILYLNLLWNARLIVYAAEDIASLAESRTHLLRAWADRLWHLSH
ncbi:hypothetical protein DFP72DRAFT_1068462 [Ephemerocybe angulata]|uniref:Uncharacterized protein n=1 Tax=Ephemerocybe angulata TaxID=980116 RepID=A0A8H6HWF5_9AGAR|nr:hypothetical protein DFP72DRAFT_1068462 [Tulosesus angulatus]